MRKFKSNAGVTLVELMVTIVVASIVTLAAVSLFLVGLRLHRKSTDTALRQNEIQVAITLMEKLVTENNIVGVDQNQILIPGEQPKERKTLLYYDSAKEAICTGDGAKLLEDVAVFNASKVSDSLIQLTVKTAGEEETYVFTVYCRMMEAEETQVTSPESAVDEGSSVPFDMKREPISEEVLTQVLEDSSVPYGVRQFLQTLTSQLGSTGRIQTAAGEGEYFSQWYIGSYEANPGWSEETPWCACFVSWALEENSHLVKGATMRFANVDAFWAEFVTADRWKTENPEPGDIVFFDWITDNDHNAQHVGVVVGVHGEWVYTVEGNTDGVVALRQYLLDDTRILGYGIPNWR